MGFQHRPVLHGAGEADGKVGAPRHQCQERLLGATGLLLLCGGNGGLIQLSAGWWCRGLWRRLQDANTPILHLHSRRGGGRGSRGPDLLPYFLERNHALQG